MSLIRKHGAVLQAWACLALVIGFFWSTIASPSPRVLGNSRLQFTILNFDSFHANANHNKQSTLRCYEVACFLCYCN